MRGEYLPGAVELDQPGRAAPTDHGLEVCVVEKNNFVIGVIEGASSSWKQDMRVETNQANHYLGHSGLCEI